MDFLKVEVNLKVNVKVNVKVWVKVKVWMESHTLNAPVLYYRSGFYAFLVGKTTVHHLYIKFLDDLVYKIFHLSEAFRSKIF
jgi:hypothetical protein